ncbi:hypothetical protein EB796_013849 [Bugula neritina]|uniref:Uncharacterized protein n=1 Tax=Bugula neritina TaxID=10212 RepID=A0A7J7JNC1_BUGNE|nr:hypothetical protein EB796_013849 [Bugula neritina]
MYAVIISIDEIITICFFVCLLGRVQPLTTGTRVASDLCLSSPNTARRLCCTVVIWTVYSFTLMLIQER